MSGPEVPAHVAVVGASAAGLACVEGLRRAGYRGRLTLIGDESELPYDRPPLSKQLLSGAWPPERLRLREAAALDALGLQLLLGRRAQAFDAGRREIRLDDGRRIGCDALVVATGVCPRGLPGTAGVRGVHVLRTLADALALREALGRGSGEGPQAGPGEGRAVIAGGGFVGAEAAAVIRTLGFPTTVVTPEASLLARQLGPEMGELITGWHRRRGVRVVTGARVRQVVAPAGHTVGVRLDDGRTLPADIVLLALGSTPNTEWLSGSGVPVGDGVHCDARLRALPGVWACGDVASWPHPAADGARVRVEHRTNASEQGLAVARALLSGHRAAPPFGTVPFLWSEQYGHRVQVLGLPRGTDRFRVVDGDPADGRFTALLGRRGRVAAAVGLGLPAAFRALRPLVAEAAPWPADPQPGDPQPGDT